MGSCYKMAMPRLFCRLQLLINKDLSFVFKHQPIRKSLCLNKNLEVCSFRRFRTHIELGSVLSKDKKQIDEHISSSSSSDDSDSDDDDVKVEYHRGLPQLTVPLPSRRERCIFTLKPISNSVGDFLEMLKKEDKGIDTAMCKSNDGRRIASSNSIETLLEEDFKLVINDRTYNVSCPKQERLTGEEVKRLADVKTLVHQLYEALNVDEHNVQKESEILQEIENLKQELLPLENQIRELETVAEKRGNWLAWAGLGFMSVQFGIMARLTWWEYSWDIMEPVTYFVTYGTAMAMYSYYVLTKEEYLLPSVTDRQKLIVLHNKAKKMGLDLQKYNQLQDQLVKLNRKLNKLKNPFRTPKPIEKPETSTGGVSSVTLANLAKTIGKSDESSSSSTISKIISK